MHAVPPDPADQDPVTTAPPTGPLASATVTVTIAVQFRLVVVVVDVRLPTHMGLAAGGSETVVGTVVDPVAPALSVTVIPTM
ncbi:MAG: hypothetical protein EPO00_02490 [Chloroflexota bacterium]|nr:MAG: hypothetical protein EPO00_02490 [Chloroflexota bacterium]